MSPLFEILLLFLIVNVVFVFLVDDFFNLRALPRTPLSLRARSPKLSWLLLKAL